MAKRLKSMRVLIILGAILSVWLSVQVILETGGGLRWIIQMSGWAALIGVAFCSWGMWRLRRWALWLSWVLALWALGFGCFGVWFAWSFWFFQEPTLVDRVKAVLHPQITLRLLCPILWLLYFTRAKIRAQFQRER